MNMTNRWREAAMLALASGITFGVHAAGPDAGVQLIGRALVSGTALDKSGLAGQPICKIDEPGVCIDQATFGGWGSGLTYTGSDNVFVAVPDRGPFDGLTDVPYKDRVHYVYIAVDPAKPVSEALKIVLLDTRLLVDESKQPLVGSAASFANRFDPEAVVVTADKSIIVSDEYGPNIFKFDKDGRLEQRIAIPRKFRLDPGAGHPSGEVDSAGNSLELYPGYNIFGRQANRGMEGLSITPDSGKLVGLMQNALIQDHGLNQAVTPPARAGFNSRILTVDLKTAATHEYVYSIDAINQGRGQNDLLAINDHEFLVLERDNRTRIPTPPNDSQSPNEKRLYRIDLNEAGLTDVSSVASLPTTTAELAAAGIKGVTKHLFLDLLNAAYTVDGTTVKDLVAEKVEGLAWGPDLPDGRHLLLVTTDNDLFAGNAAHPDGLPTQVYAFAIDGAAAGIDYVPQQMKGPLFPPGQVRKIAGK